MKVAALYDVHAMPWALEAVLAEVDADAIVFGGDYLYGPYPRETVATIRALDAQVLRGQLRGPGRGVGELATCARRSGLAAVASALNHGRRRSLLPRSPDQQSADHDRDHS